MSEVSSSNNSTSTPVAAPPDADLEWRGGDVLLQALAAGTLAQAGARLSTSRRVSPLAFGARVTLFTALYVASKDALAAHRQRRDALNAALGGMTTAFTFAAVALGPTYFFSAALVGPALGVAEHMARETLRSVLRQRALNGPEPEPDRRPEREWQPPAWLPVRRLPAGALPSVKRRDSSSSSLDDNSNDDNRK